MITRAWVGLMLALTLFYVLTLFGRGVILIQDPSLIAKAMGLGILVLPLFALWGLFMEVRFGLRSQQLAKRLVTMEIPGLDLELRASGRATKESATRELDRIKKLAAADSASWTTAFLLGEAYAAAGDRRNARSAIRRAILLADDSKPSNN
jgi:hypothetical protein